MSELRSLIAKRERLVAQAAAQRATLAQGVAPWRPRLVLVDRGIAVVRYVSRYPTVMAAAGLAVAALRPHRVAGWLESGLILWQVGRSVWRRRSS